MPTRSTPALCAQVTSSAWPAAVLEMVRCSIGAPPESMRHPARVSLWESIPITAMIIVAFLSLRWLWQTGPVVRIHALTSPKAQTLL